jgi:methionine-rich copper-binding protein CopC
VRVRDLRPRHEFIRESVALLVRNRAVIVGTSIVALLVLILNVRIAAGHAVLLESAPAAAANIKGPDVPIRLRYNVRIEAARSRLSLVAPDNTVIALSIGQQPSPDTLTANATGLKSGAYRLRWQVLASDGHITRGEVAFKVGS